MFMKILKEALVLGLGMFVGSLFDKGLRKVVNVVQEKYAAKKTPPVRSRASKKTKK